MSAEKISAMGSNQNTVIFTSSRMNPPTPGHLLLIEHLILTAVDKSVQDVHVILSKSNSDNKNPIHCNHKIDLLQQSRTASDMTSALKRMMCIKIPDLAKRINAVQVHYRCVLPDQPSPFSQISMLISEYLTRTTDLNLFLIVGSDRIDTADSVTNQYLFKNPQIYSMDCLILGREETDTYKNMSKPVMGALDISIIPQSAFSASFVRQIVKNELFEKFREIYIPFLENITTIETLYSELLAGLDKPSPKKEATKKVATSPIIERSFVFPIIRDTPYFDALVLEKEEKEEKKSAKGKTKSAKVKSPKSTTRKTITDYP